MALTDPQTIKIGETESSLPRVNTGSFSSQYESSDGSVVLKLSTQESGRKRHVVRVDVTKITEDPFSANNVEVSMSCYIVIDRPLVGYTNAEALEVVAGLLSLSTASSSSLLKKLLGSES
jgi:hypothetical protein